MRDGHSIGETEFPGALAVGLHFCAATLIVCLFHDAGIQLLFATPDEALAMRASEGLFFFTILLSLHGWVACLTGRLRKPVQIKWMSLIAVPIAFGIVGFFRAAMIAASTRPPNPPIVSTVQLDQVVFLVSAIFPLGFGFLLACLLWSQSLAWFRLARSSEGQCERCGYDLTHLSGSVCPECGPVEKVERKPTLLDRHPNAIAVVYGVVIILIATGTLPRMREAEHRVWSEWIAILAGGALVAVGVCRWLIKRNQSLGR